MLILRSIDEVHALRQQWQTECARVGFVPTMGNLHAGHLSLVTCAQLHCSKVIASIFVNPTQFGPNEDFTAYPRTLEADITALKTVGCNALFVPDVSMLYPESADVTQILAAKTLSEQLCGASRPGHFDGVCTVVNKLLNIVQPDELFLGEKDRQQLLILKKMVADFAMNVKVTSVATYRETTGLAMSSRNHYLSEAEKISASLLFACLTQASEEIRGTTSGECTQALLQQCIDKIEKKGWQQLKEQGFQPDYFKVLCAQTLQAVTTETQDIGLFVAAKLGKPRLIDNVVISRT